MEITRGVEGNVTYLVNCEAVHVEGWPTHTGGIFRSNVIFSTHVIDPFGTQQSCRLTFSCLRPRAAAVAIFNSESKHGQRSNDTLDEYCTLIILKFVFFMYAIFR